MKYKLLYLYVLMFGMLFPITSCNDSKDSASIEFELPGMFYLGEIKRLPYIVRGGTSVNFTVSGTPKGWRVFIDETKKLFIIDCQQVMPGMSKDGTVHITFSGEDNGSITIPLRCDASVGSPFYNNNEVLAGIIITPGTGKGDGVALYLKERSDVILETARAYGGKLGPNWRVPQLNELKEIYEIWSNNKDWLNERLMDIGGDPIDGNVIYWSNNVVEQFDVTKSLAVDFNNGDVVEVSITDVSSSRYVRAF